jgi:multidrug resistance efflux pump
MSEERESATGVVRQAPPSAPAPSSPDGATNGASSGGGPPGNGPGPSGGGEPASPRPARFSIQQLRTLLIPGLVILALAAGAVGINYYFTNLWYVSTDNAQVTGTPVPVGSINPGTVESIPVQVGESVHQGQELATVVLPIVSNSAVVRAPIVAPFDAVVIQIPVGVGATVTPGQAIVMIVDPSTVYVRANIAENDVQRVSPGQAVDVTLDALSITVPGTVDSITPASAATFSLLPQDNTTGTFTKVTQLVPVKITIDTAAQSSPVGTSAEVKIHVAPGH